jgi:hypothetical protein
MGDIMRLKLEYHRAMRYWMPVLAVVLLLTFSAAAQVVSPPSVTSPGFGGRPINGVPPSVTSFGFGGHPGFNGVPPSVTSVGRGFTSTHPGRFGPDRDIHHDHHHHFGYAYPYYPYYPYYVPYYPAEAYDDGPGDPSMADSQDDPEEDQGGPTIFDRRGPGQRAPNDYDTPSRKANVPRPPAPVTAQREEPAAPVATKAPEPSIAVQPPTILIFKDGHKQEVGNYAIVGTNLFDLTPGHRLKIALKDLDVVATQKANDDQGIEFKLPELPNGN